MKELKITCSRNEAVERTLRVLDEFGQPKIITYTDYEWHDTPQAKTFLLQDQQALALAGELAGRCGYAKHGDQLQPDANITYLVTLTSVTSDDTRIPLKVYALHICECGEITIIEPLGEGEASKTYSCEICSRTLCRITR